MKRLTARLLTRNQKLKRKINGSKLDLAKRTKDRSGKLSGDLASMAQASSSVYQAAWSIFGVGGRQLSPYDQNSLPTPPTETHLLHDDKPQLSIKLRATLIEARGSMRDIDFSPSEFGVKLVSHFRVLMDSLARCIRC